MIGKIIRPKQESIATARTVAGKIPLKPQRPQFHRDGRPPTGGFHKGHPTLSSPAVPGALPVKATQGVSQNQLGAYLAALRGK